MWLRALRLPAGAIFAGLVFMSEVSKDAAANLGWWLSQGGFPEIGGWLEKHGTQILAPWLVWVWVIAAIVCFFGPFVWRHLPHTQKSYVAIDDVLRGCVAEIRKTRRKWLPSDANMTRAFFYMLLSMAEEGVVALYGVTKHNDIPEKIDKRYLDAVSFSDDHDVIMDGHGRNYSGIRLTRQGATKVFKKVANLPSTPPYPSMSAPRQAGFDSSRWTGLSERSPLEISFDPENPGRKFWSLENPPIVDGKPQGDAYWQYRALIRNASWSKTMRNVWVTVEAVGVMPTRPETSLFDINKKPIIDLTPRAEALAVIRTWPHPVIVQGMALGPGVYGPIKMTVGADDVPLAMKYFQFDPMKTPMITEMKPPS